MRPAPSWTISSPHAADADAEVDVSGGSVCHIGRREVYDLQGLSDFGERSHWL